MSRPITTIDLTRDQIVESLLQLGPADEALTNVNQLIEQVGPLNLTEFGEALKIIAEMEGGEIQRTGEDRPELALADPADLIDSTVHIAERGAILLLCGDVSGEQADTLDLDEADRSIFCPVCYGLAVMRSAR